MDTNFFKNDRIAIILSETGENDPEELFARCLDERGRLPWPAAEVDCFMRGGRFLLLVQPSPPLLRRTRRGDPRYRRRS